MAKFEYTVRIAIDSYSVSKEIKDKSTLGWRLHTCTWYPQGFMLVFERVLDEIPKP